MMETQEQQAGAEQSAQQEMTVDQLINYFREGHGPVGAHVIIEWLDAAVADNVQLGEAVQAEIDGHAETGRLLDAAEEKIADLTARLEAADKAANDAKAKVAKLSEGAKAARPRRIGPVKEPLPIDKLKAAIAEADTVEILFGDGKSEVGAPPILVEGDAWRDHALGLMLTEPVEIHGPAQGSQPYHVAGAALLLDGKLVAWCERPERLTVGAGQKYALSNDIFF